MTWVTSQMSDEVETYNKPVIIVLTGLKAVSVTTDLFHVLAQESSNSIANALE